MRLSIHPFKFVLLLAGPLCVAAMLAAGPARALDSRRGLAQFSRQAWQTENGLPQNTAHAVAQTADGYLWVATEEGLARFDGQGFVVFDKQNTPRLRSNDIRDLLPGAGNVLWVSTSAGLARLSRGEWKTFTRQDGLPADDVETTLEDRDGAVWVGTSAGLSRFKDGAFKTYTTREGLAGDSVQALFEDRDGALWVGTRDGLSRFKDDRFTSYTAQDGLPGGGVDAIRQGADGRLWLGTPDGLASFADGRFNVYTTADGLPNNRVIALHADKEGALWVGTAAGLSRLREGRFENYAAGEALSNGIVLSIFEDAEGSLWVGTESGGLHQLKDKKFETYTARDGLASDLVKSVYEDRRGQVWVGTYGGGLTLVAPDGKLTTYTTKDGLASNIVLALFDDAGGNLWVGTPDGLSKFKDGRFETYTSADGLANDFVRSIYADRAGALWVGTRGGLTRMKDGAFRLYTTRDGLPDDFVGTIYEDAAGDIWAGTLGGLGRFRDGAFTSYTTRDGLSDNVVIALHGDAEGRLWIGTNGGGLNLLRGGRFHAFTTRDGLPHDTVYRILEDDSGNLWMSCNKGVFRLAKRELEEFADGKRTTLAPVVYGTADGMTTRECSGGGHPSGWRDREGRLWFSTIKGVNVIDPAGLRTNTEPPPAVIEQVRVDGEPVGTFDDKADLAPGKTRFDFHYAGLSFVAPEKVRYKYRLEGFDKDWIDGGAHRVAYYTNLGPGDYRFEVLASNNDGVWSSAPASFAFTLRPHFYRTPWFYALAALALALVAAQVYLLRVRQMKARFAAVLAERNRIARELHDNLAQEILGVSVQLELVARLLPRSTEAARPHLDRARALVRASIAEARRYVWDLRSQSLEDRDLAAALSEMTRRLTAESGVQTKFEVSGTFRPLGPQVENNLLRIGQEAVNNAVRHARARLITVSLSFDARRVRLSVRDDGRGFDPRANGGGAGGGHFGILGMRERAAEMGGTVEIDSREGAGTEVVVGVPIEG